VAVSEWLSYAVTELVYCMCVTVNVSVRVREYEWSGGLSEYDYEWVSDPMSDLVSELVSMWVTTDMARMMMIEIVELISYDKFKQYSLTIVYY